MNDSEATVFVNYDKNNSGSELEQAYMELGKRYYEGRFEDPLPELLPLFDKITRIKGTESGVGDVCPGCGSALKPGAVFCGKCGRRVG